MNGMAFRIRQLGVGAALFLFAISARADPIAPYEVPLVQIGTVVTITLAIFLEAICVMLLLRRSRTPRWFVLWLMGMHLFTYPLFLFMVWLLDSLRPALVITAAEGLIVLVEGGLIYLMCRFGPSAKAKKELAAPSITRSMVVSLIGNICSAAAFPLLVFLYGIVSSHISIWLESTDTGGGAE
jgi:hypothetical protein